LGIAESLYSTAREIHSSGAVLYCNSGKLNRSVNSDSGRTFFFLIHADQRGKVLHQQPAPTSIPARVNLATTSALRKRCARVPLKIRVAPSVFRRRSLVTSANAGQSRKVFR